MNKVVLVARPDRYVVEEARALAQTAGYDPVALVTQSYLNRAKFGVGMGKAEEISRVVREVGADLILFDAALRPTQAYALAKLCHVEVRDREKIILEIFAKRASTAEAKVQVQLAELQYELPKAKDSVRMAKKGEQPGFFGLGKYDIDVYTRMMKARIAVLRKKVRQVANRREIFRERRESLMFPTVALAGYTAAGKTTLFNRLVDEHKEVAAGVFTTLSPTTRALELGEKRKRRRVLVTDTVGFISNLPAYLFESFGSTLEEISCATVVLLLLDISEPAEKLIRSFRSSSDVLLEMNVHPSRIVVVLNKCDLETPSGIEEKKRILGLRSAESAVVAVSAGTGQGTPQLLREIEERIESEEQGLAVETAWT